MVVNREPYPISFEEQKSQALICRYGEEGRQYILRSDVDLSGLTVSLQIVKPDNTFVVSYGEVIEPEEGDPYIRITIPLQATVVKGLARYSIFVTDAADPDFVVYSAEGYLWVDDHLITDEMIESTAEVYGLRFPQDFLTVENLVDIVNYVVASLLNDETISETTTWSSQKIEQEISGIEPEPITATEHGNPIEIPDAAAAPLVKCVTQITGYQEGTGTPSPDNIRPIVAYTEGEIEVRGKNMFNKASAVTNALLNSSTGAAETNIDPNHRYGISDYIRVFSGNTYYLPYTGSARNWFYNLSKMALNLITSGGTYTPTQDGYIRLSFSTEINNIQNVFDAYQVEKGSTPTTYEPYKGTTHTTTYPSAIYRGSEDCVNGEVNVTFIKASSLFWSYSNTGYFYATPNPAMKGVTSGSEIPTLICDRYETTTPNNVYSGGKDCSITTSTASPFSIWIRDNSYNGNVTNFANDMANSDIVYELATPTTSPVTPTNLPIKSLSGYNHIESSTGEMEVEYIRNTYQPIVDLIQSSSHVYSTAEQVVGKWIDGKDLYEITLDTTSPATTNTNATIESLSTLSFDKIVSVEGMIYAAGVSQYVPIFWSYNNSIIGSVYIDGTNLKQIVSSAAYCNCREWITIRYTKTS